MISFRRFVLLALASTNGMWLAAQEPVAPAPTDPQSYFMGYNIGSDLAANGFIEKDFVIDQFLKGLLDALVKKDPALSEAEMRSTSAAIGTKLQTRANDMAKANLDKAQAFLAENKTKDGVQTLKSGLQYKVLKKGDGKSPGLKSTVRVHYEGKLIDGTVFDSSLKRGQPAEFSVDGVIPGWTEALQRMVVGDKWQLTIPPDLAYGAEGSRSIGPNETLIFEVELLDILR